MIKIKIITQENARFIIHLPTGYTCFAIFLILKERASISASPIKQLFIKQQFY